jgi:Transcriptional regulator containing an amidase domain and an AraC-type DNA-binding HTH domain
MSNHEIIILKAGLPVKFDIYKSYNRLIPSHWHNHLEVLYICQGSMQIVRNDERYTIHENDLFIVNSGDIHLTRSLGNVEVLCLLIPFELIDNSISGYNSIRFREYFSHNELNEDPAFNNMIHQMNAMRTLYEQGEDGFQFLFISKLNLFLYTLYHNYAVRQNIDFHKVSKNLSRFKELLDYVEINYSEPLSSKEASSFVALNPEYFCRSFKKFTGLTFMEYVNMVRLTHIHRDILDTDDSIIAIQERHGFINYKVFSRMFKEAYGCTPSKLRVRK